jgi:Ca-activated chloride channel family protein
MQTAAQQSRMGTRTALALTAASATVALALALTPKAPTPADALSPLPSAGGILTARMASTQVAPGDQHIAVTIRMPDLATQTRPPLSLAIVIDRSGSMEGEPLMNAKAAASRLIDQLDANDAFSVITYSSSDEIVMPMTRATADNKATARGRIMQIWDDGNTCISCGIERATEQLQATPVTGGVRRMVLISDGQANSGLYNRDELVAFANETAARGMSISAVGVGLDFDEVTMMRIADVGHGNYYFVEDTKNLTAMFTRELDSLGHTVAADARLVIDPADGTVIEEAYGYHLLRQGSRVVLTLADLRAGETRKVVLRTTLANTLGTRPVAHFELHWRRVQDGAQDHAFAELSTTLTNDTAAIASSIDPVATTAIEEARTARVLEDATTVYERDGYEAAQRVLERHMREVHANKAIAAPATMAIEKASNEAIVNFSKAPPAKAKKAARSAAYDLAR